MKITSAKVYRTIPLCTGVYRLAVNVTFQHNIWPQSDPPPSTKAELEVLVHQP